MLLQQEDCAGTVVLSASGDLDQAAADGLLAATGRLLACEPRGIVIDLSEVPSVSDAAQHRLAALVLMPSGWPRSPLVVCPSGVLPEAPATMVAPDRTAALARVEERASRPRTRMVVPHDTTGPAKARAAVCGSEHLRLTGMSDEVALVVSEMVTNAVRHAAPPVHLEVEATDDEVLVAVCDGSPVPPAMRDADEEAEGGRGMLLVDLLAREHGVRVQPPGKTVWARLGRPR